MGARRVRGTGKVGSRGGLASWALAVATVAVSACAKPLSSPEVIGGGEQTVSIKAGQWSNVDGAANKHCAKYGKRAVARGRTRLSGTEITNLYIYDCVPDDQR